ncbi:MAG: AI-2E family transporter [Longicatena sp.]
MKFKLTDEMRKKIWMYAIIIGIGISIYFAFYRFEALAGLFSTVVSLTTPFVLGFALAFLLNKPMMFFERKLFGKLSCKPQMKRNLSAILAMIVAIVVVLLFLGMLIPQLLDCILSLVSAFPGYVNVFHLFSLYFMEKNQIDQTIIDRYLNDSDILARLTDIVTKALPQMARMTYQLGSTLLNILLGIMAGLYMMMDKERLSGYVKKINYAIFPDGVSEYFHRMVLASGDIFNNFIVGKAIDSLIIGILCYVGSLIFNFPYALLLSVFVGVTNMIPVFGPFIGAVPGIVILFIIDPLTAVWFALFIFALQQFDGNILGPLILGDKLGLPTIGILFSVCIGGGLFGILGMFIGVPCFAVFYMALREWVHYRLSKKELDLDQISERVQKEAKILENETEA